jgi:hypothetical protein
MTFHRKDFPASDRLSQTEEKGTTNVTNAERSTRPQSHRTGFFAPLRALLGAKGTSASSHSTTSFSSKYPSAETTRDRTGDSVTRSAAMASAGPSGGRTQGVRMAAPFGRLRTMRRAAYGAASVVLIGAGAFVMAAPAQAEAPWWHVTSGSRPSYIDPSHGKPAVPEIPGIPGEPEIQEIISPLAGGEGAFELHAGSNNLGFFSYPEGAFGLEFASPANLEAALKPFFPAEEIAVTETLAGERWQVKTRPGATIEATDAGLGTNPEAKIIQAGTAGTPGTPEVPAVPDGEIYVRADNIGNQTISGAAVPIKVSDLLPSGLEAVAVEGTRPYQEAEFIQRKPLRCGLEASPSGQLAFCTLSRKTEEEIRAESEAKNPGQVFTLREALAPFDVLEMRIAVNVKAGGHTGEVNTATASGGEGFICQAVPPGTGEYRDSGCMDEVAGAGANFARVATGAVPAKTVQQPIVISGAPVPFAVERYELENEEEGAVPAEQAGSHPFQSSTTITLNQTADSSAGKGTEKPHVNPVALPKDLHFNWPPGMIGNPSGVAQCTDSQFFSATENDAATLCPATSAVGVAEININEPSNLGVGEVAVPLFNLVPHFGEPARFGFNVTVGNAPVVIDTSLRSDGDYGVTVETNNITQTAAFLSATVSVWGAPGDPRHNRQRGSACLLESRGFVTSPVSEGGVGTCASTETSELQHPVPFLFLPTTCGTAQPTTALGDIWVDPLAVPDFPTLASYSMPTLGGCNKVPFAPTVQSAPDSTASSAPTGLSFDIDIHDEGQENFKGLVQSQLKKVVVALPTGITTNPSVAGGLSACTLAQYRAEELGTQTCPESSKVGEVEIESPLVKPIIHGSVYVAKQHDNPADNLLSIYMVAKNPELGVLVKSSGAVTPNPQTGQLTTVFDELPQLPFSHFHFAFRGGQRAPLITPGLCGKYTTQAELYPYSNPGAPVERPTTFQIGSGPNGGPCASTESQLPNKPSLEAGTLTPIAGAYSPFVFKVRREDGSQVLKSIEATLPEGLLGKLAGVKECSNAQIAQAEGRGGEGQGVLELASPSCPAASEVGVVNVGTGVGPQPYMVQGKAYLAGPYKGAPLSLAIITPAVVGPFDLGTIVVRTALYVDETTAQITAKSDPIPTIVHGLPTVVQSISLNMNRPDFTINPTSCDPKAITGSATSTLGNVAPLQNRFQVGACGALGFKPQLKLSLKGATKRAGVPALKAVLTYPKGSYANVKSVSTVLPKSEFIDNAHIGNTCTRVQFNAGAGQGAQCPAKSLLGHAIAYSPLIEKPLEGNVYLRSNGGERELPDIVAALKGQIDVTLVGFIDSVGKKNSEVSRIRTRFMNVPDAPVSRFVLQLAGAKKGLLQNSANLCKVKNIAQVKATAQNGKIYDTEPAVANDCGKKGKKKNAGKGKSGSGK